MTKFRIETGEEIGYKNETYFITDVINLKYVLAKKDYDADKIKIPIEEIVSPNNIEKTNQIDLISEEDWAVAKMRFDAIEPLLDIQNKFPIIKNIEKERGIDRSTIYRWLDRYENSYMLSSLVPIKRQGGKGKSRLANDLEELMQVIIDDHYLNSQKLKTSRLYIDLQLACRSKGITPPHINTLRNRIRAMNESELLQKRRGNKRAKETFEPIKGKYNHSEYPLSVVQIDHTLLDIILVDSQSRLPIGRPWITVAIDVYSRMILGFYVSFDPPSAMSVGLCLSNAILPKEKHLLSLDIEGEWPCWGVMKTVHADNAREFKGSMIRKACEEYGINIQWRPIGKPEWGGHVERLIGTIVSEIHSLPGTTFSNIKDRDNYNSVSKSAISLRELEKYLATFIVNVYHMRKHSSIGVSPLFAYKEGLLGGQGTSPVGLPMKIENEDKLKKDFMPFIQRTIQRDGITIDKINYYHEVLRRWINSKVSGSKTEKKKFIFRRDPRDITIVYFLDPELEKYFPIPCRDLGRPAISIWEYRDAVKILQDKRFKQNQINEDAIFDAYETLNQIKEESKKKTRQVKKKRHTKEGRKQVHGEIKRKNLSLDNELPLVDIKPFDDIDYETPAN